MSSKPLEERRKEVEESVSDFRYDRFQRFIELGQEYEKQGHLRQAEELKTEAAALMLITTGDSFPSYFQPIAVFSDGTTVPPREFFTPDRLDYLSIKAKNSKNPIVSARFADVVWDLSSRKDPDMARLAIARYLEATHVLMENRWGLEFGDAFKRSAELACRINDLDWVYKVKEAILQSMDELDAKQDHRFCLDLAEAIARSRPMQLTPDECQRVVGILTRAASYFQAEHPDKQGSLGPVGGPNEHLVRAFLKVMLDMRTCKDLIEAEDLRMAIAQSYEREGDRAFGVGNSLAALTFYTEAEKTFIGLGRSDYTRRLRVKMAKSGRLTEGEMKEISTKVEISRSRIEAFIGPLVSETLEESLLRVAATPYLVPNVEQTESVVKSLSSSYPLHFMLPKVMLKEGHIVGYGSSRDELLDMEVTRELMVWAKISSIFIRELFEALKNKGLDAPSLTAHFERWGFCRERNIALLREGFDHYFKGDFVASLHILTLQFEDVLRSLLEASGEPVFDDQAQRFVILDTLLRNGKLTAAAGRDLIRYYKVVLIDRQGLNLRNELAHGLLDPSEMNRSTTELVIYVLLTLTRFRIQEIQEVLRGS